MDTKQGNNFTIMSSPSAMQMDIHAKPHTIVPLKLDFAAEKRGGMAVSTVWRLACFLAPSPSDRSTQARRAVPLYYNPKASGFWYQGKEAEF